MKKHFTSLASMNCRAAAAGKLPVIHSWTKQQNQSFSRPKATENLEQNPQVVKTKPRQLFKKHLQTQLLQFLVHVGVCADVF
mgnify:CR=1 FL=1